MDLNYRHHRHQVWLMRAEASASADAGLAHVASAPRTHAMAVHTAI